MSEEDINKLLDIDRMLLRENTNLKIICKHLEDRVDKAIEYIETHTNKCMFELRIEELEELLEILGGEDICHVEKEEKVKEEDK